MRNAALPAGKSPGAVLSFPFPRSPAEVLNVPLVHGVSVFFVEHSGPLSLLSELLNRSGAANGIRTRDPKNHNLVL